MPKLKFTSIKMEYYPHQWINQSKVDEKSFIHGRKSHEDEIFLFSLSELNDKHEWKNEWMDRMEEEWEEEVAESSTICSRLNGSEKIAFWRLLKIKWRKAEEILFMMFSCIFSSIYDCSPASLTYVYVFCKREAFCSGALKGI